MTDEHRCPNMPENFRVRNELHPGFSCKEPGWRLLKCIEDFGLEDFKWQYNTPYYVDVANIKYCPFCGARMEEKRDE